LSSKIDRPLATRWEAIAGDDNVGVRLERDAWTADLMWAGDNPGDPVLSTNTASCFVWCHIYELTYLKNNQKCGPMPNVMAALRNIVGALCSMPQSLADAQYWSAVQ